MVLDDLKTFPRTFKVLLASALIENMAFGLIIPFLALYITQDVGLDEWMAGVVLAGYTVAGVPSMIIGGMLADKFGRRPVLLASLGLMSFTMFMYFFASSFATLMILVLADSFVGMMYMPAANAMIADIVKPVDRPRAFSALRVGWNVGIVFGPVLGWMIVSAYSMRLLFVFGALILACAFVLNFVFIRETRPEKIESAAITFRSVVSVRHDKAFLVLCLLTAVFWFFFAQWISVLPVYANEALGIGEGDFGLLFAISAIMVVTLQMWVTSQVVRFRRSVVLASGQLVASVGFGLIFFATDFISLGGCILVMTGGEILYMSVVSAVIADLSPENKRGVYMGFSGLVQQVGNGLGFLVGMSLLGMLADTSVIWLLFGFVGTVSTAGYIVFAKVVGRSVDMPGEPEAAPVEGMH